jgi:transposase-like protein
VDEFKHLAKVRVAGSNPVFRSKWANPHPVDSFCENLAVSHQEVDMPFRYSSEFRRQACERMLAGESVKDLVAELSVDSSTLYKWRRQALIDAGRSDGLKSYEADRLAQARRRIKELEDELKLVKAAAALYDEIEVISPKGSTRLSEG